MRFNTTLLHGVDVADTRTGATLPPVYQSSAFSQESPEMLEKIFNNRSPGFSYTRINNPTVEAFERKMTLLEEGAASVACASGMAAITNAFLNILRAGDEIVTSASLYGGTIDLLKDLQAFGIHTHFVENNNRKQFEDAINEHTRLIFAETIGNPKLDVTDIASLSELAHSHGLPLIVDNTVATSCLARPITLGADIVVNSTSKYINGNSSGISGVITDSGKFSWDAARYPGMKEYLKFGTFSYTAKLRNGLFRNMGACLSPQNAYLNLLGMETLGLRMERQCKNALALAEYLQGLEGVTVNYPGLPSSPWHKIAKEQLKGGYGAILTLRTGSKERAFALMNRLTIPLNVSNIGDTKTLMIHPESTLALHSTAKEKEEAGVFDDLIRVSVGIEDIEDLIQDFSVITNL